MQLQYDHPRSLRLDRESGVKSPPDARFVDLLLPGLHLDLPELRVASGKRAFSGGEHPISAAAGGMHSVQGQLSWMWGARRDQCSFADLDLILARLRR